MIPIKLLAKRVYCLITGYHNMKERTMIRYCLRCGWMEIKEGDEWVTYDDVYDDSELSPSKEKILSEELFEYLDYAESKGWK